MNFIETDDSTEHKLVEALREGSIDAFNYVYKIYVKRLLSYIAVVTKNKEDAEELVHDIFMSLWKNRTVLQPDTNISTFLFAIAYKKRIDYFRKQLRSPIFEDYQKFSNDLISNENSQLEYHDFCEIFNRAIELLPDRLRNFVVLSRIKGLSEEEIAAKLNISVKTVRNGLSISLKLLKDYLVELINKHNL